MAITKLGNEMLEKQAVVGPVIGSILADTLTPYEAEKLKEYYKNNSTFNLNASPHTSNAIGGWVGGTLGAVPGAALTALGFSKHNKWLRRGGYLTGILGSLYGGALGANKYSKPKLEELMREGKIQ